jgi:hypothetical protein
MLIAFKTSQSPDNAVTVKVDFGAGNVSGSATNQATDFKRDGQSNLSSKKMYSYHHKQ